MTDMINPTHYRGDRQFEPIAVIEDWGLNYRLGNALKYISRNGRKPGEDPREGLKKAIWYLEREIAAYEEPAPYNVKYEDVLDYYGQSVDLEEAWPVQAAQEVPFTWDCQDEYDFSLNLGGNDGPVGSGGTDTIFSVNDFWAEGQDELYATGWDPTLGPVEISTEEVASILARKDLKQFEDDEIVSTVERRGMVIGFKKDGSSCILKDGRCV